MIKIDILKNHPSTILELAHIWHEVLGKTWLPELPIQYIQEQLIESWINDNTLPLAYIVKAIATWY